MSKNPVKWIKSLSTFVWDVAKHWYHGGLGDLAAGVTFWILLSVPALVLAMVSGLGWLSKLTGQGFVDEISSGVVDFFDGIFDNSGNEVTDLVASMFEQTSSGIVTFSILLAMWTISRGFAGLIRALDEVYDVEDGRAWYHTRVVALFLGLGTFIVAAPIAALEIYVWPELDLGAAEGPLRAGVAVLILVLWASIIFYYGPATRSRWRWDLPGAVIAAVMWWGMSRGFEFYVDLITAGEGNGVSGAIGGGLLALTWIWLASQVLLIGAAVNSALGDRFGIDRGKRSWRLNEKIFRTGEIKKVIVDESPKGGANAAATTLGAATAKLGAKPAPAADVEKPQVANHDIARPIESGRAVDLDALAAIDSASPIAAAKPGLDLLDGFDARVPAMPTRPPSSLGTSALDS